MARGQLGTRIMEHFGAHPEAQTVKQIKDALNAPSAGAIGYALDKLILEKKMRKLDGKPARYQPTGVAPDPVIAEPVLNRTEPGGAVQAREKPARRKKERKTTASSQEEEGRILEEEIRKTIVSSSPCGYCSGTNTLAYHKSQCPGIIRGATFDAKGARADWKCCCYHDGHHLASDYGADMLQEDDAVQAEVAQDSTVHA